MYFYFLFVFFSSNFFKEIFSIFFLWIIPFLNYKQYVGAEKNTLMSISGGLGPSIFCRKMEKARPMREEMDGKVVYFPPESAFWLSCCNLSSTFPYLYLDLACKQSCFPPRKWYKWEKWKYRRFLDCCRSVVLTIILNFVASMHCIF